MIDRAPVEQLRYVESSAVLSLLLLEHPIDRSIEPIFREPQRMVTSVLTLIECQRTILRARSQGRLNHVSTDSARFRLSQFAERCSVFQLDDDVVALASEPMGDDLIRTLDAIHVATALIARRSIGPLEFVSLDHRLRAVAMANGFSVLPKDFPLASPPR